MVGLSKLNRGALNVYFMQLPAINLGRLACNLSHHRVMNRDPAAGVVNGETSSLHTGKLF
jgi:hypothetical protein